MTVHALTRTIVPGLYLLIAILWLLLAAKVPQLLPQSPVPSDRLRRVTLFATIVALALGVDASYWLVANLSRYGFLHDNGAVDAYLRIEWRVMVIKFPLLASAIAFYLVLKFSSTALAVETEQVFFSRFVEYTWDAVCITDPDGRVRQWNQAAVNLFGFTKQAVLGKNLKEFLIPIQYHAETDRLWAQIKTTRQGKTDYHAQRLTANGGLIPADISISPILDGPRFRGYFGIMRDARPGSATRYFHLQPPRHIDKYAFVLMPFSNDVVHQDVWHLAIRGAVEAAGLRAVRADTDTLIGQVMDHVYSDIRNADIIIADLTGANPNVFYELGIAQAADKAVVQMVAKGSRLPFDVQGVRTLEYDPADLDDLKASLVTAIQLARG